MSRNDPRKDPLAIALRAVIEDVIEREQLSGLLGLADVVADTLADRPPVDRAAYLALLDAVAVGSRQVNDDRQAYRQRAADRIAALDAELVTVARVLEAWSQRRISEAEARQRMGLDDDEDLEEIARHNEVKPPR